MLERGTQDAEAEDEAAGLVDSGTNAPNELISWFEQNIGALVVAESAGGSGDGGRGRGRGRGGRGSGGGRGGRGAGGRGKACAARARQTQDTSSESGTHESSHMPPRGRRVSAAAAAAAAAADANCVLLSHEELSTIKNELEGMREQMEHARDAVMQHQKELERQAQQRQRQRELQRRRQACLLPSANSSGTQLTEQAGARVPHFGMEQVRRRSCCRFFFPLICHLILWCSNADLFTCIVDPFLYSSLSYFDVTSVGSSPIN